MPLVHPVVIQWTQEILKVSRSRWMCHDRRVRGPRAGAPSRQVGSPSQTNAGLGATRRPSWQHLTLSLVKVCLIEHNTFDDAQGCGMHQT